MTTPGDHIRARRMVRCIKCGAGLSRRKTYCAPCSSIVQQKTRQDFDRQRRRGKQ